MSSVRPDALAQRIYVLIRDEATGKGKTGLVYNSPGAAVRYIRPGASPVPVTLATLGSVAAEYTEGGFLEIDGVNMPGLYVYHPPEASWASGVGNVVHYFKFDGCIEVAKEYELAPPVAIAEHDPGSFTSAAFAADMANYPAKVWLGKNTSQARDEILVAFFTNDGQEEGDNIVNPQIWAYSPDSSDPASDADELIAPSSLVRVGGNGSDPRDEFVYFASGAERMINGRTYIFKVRHDGMPAGLWWPQPLSRDEVV